MNRPPPGPDTLLLLRRLMQQEIDASERLGSALAAEREALGRRDPAALEAAIAGKLAATRELQQRLEAHEGFLAARGLPPGRPGTERFLSLLPADGEERRLWRRLQELARECRDGNEVNGNLVSLSRVRTQRALEILRGPADAARTYGRLGQTHCAGRSQFIGSV
jgi:flagella synthesis protein FlgN